MDEQQSSSRQSQDLIISDLINIKIKTIDSKNYQFQVENDISIKALKEKIASTVDIDPDSQRMIFCGRVLADDKTLKFYKIDEGKVIHVVKRTQPPTRNNDATNNNRNQQSNPNNNVRNTQSRFSTFRNDDGSSVYMGTFSMDNPANIINQSINQLVRNLFSNRNGLGNNNQTDQSSQSSSNSSSQEATIRNRYDQIRRLHYYIGTNFDILENLPFLRNSDQQIRPTDENHQITTAEYIGIFTNTLQYFDRLRPHLNQFLTNNNNSSSSNNNSGLNVSDNFSIIMRISHHLSHVLHLLTDFQIDQNNPNSPIRLNTLNINPAQPLNATSVTESSSSGRNVSTNRNQNNNNNNETNSTSNNTNNIQQPQSQNSSSTNQQEPNNSTIESQAEILSSLSQSTIAESASQNPFPRTLGATSIPLPGGNGSIVLAQSPILFMEVESSPNIQRNIGTRSISNFALPDFNVTLNNFLNNASNGSLNPMFNLNTTNANTNNNNVSSTSSTTNNNSNSVHSNASNTNGASTTGSTNQQSNETNNGQQPNSNTSNNNDNSNSTPINALQSLSMRFDPFLPCSSTYTVPEIRSATNLSPISINANIFPDSLHQFQSLFDEMQNSDSSAPNDFDMLTELGNLLHLDNPTNRPDVNDGSQPFFDFLRFLLNSIEQLSPGSLSVDLNGDHGPITIEDYMRRFDLFHSDDTSFMSRMFSVLLQNLSFQNFHQLFNFNFRDFGRLREPLQEFIRANLLSTNMEFGIDNVRRELGVILDQNETLLINVTQNLNPAVGVNPVKSLRIFLQETLVKFLDQIMRSSNDENFEQDVTSALNYLVSSYIHFCNACFASPEESRIQLIQNFLNQYPDLIDSHFITLTIALLKIRIDAVAQNLSDEYRAEVVNNIVFNGESRPADLSANVQCDEQSNSYDSEVEFADACSDILPPSTASTSATIRKNTSDKNDSVNQQKSTPEEWEAVVPDEWVQTIKEDIEKQKNIDNDHLPPFSEAYLNGMSKKRRHEHDQQPK